VNPWLALTIFGVALIGDVFWTRWSLAVTSKRALHAAMWGVMICLPAIVWAPAYVQSRWYGAPYAAGAGVGTYLTVRHAERKEATDAVDQHHPDSTP
jgi:hypothetical protein